MYEKTIAETQRIYEITIPATPTKIYDLLDVASKEDYNSIVNQGIRPYRGIEGMSNQKYRRIPLDGYIKCYLSSFYVSDERQVTFETIGDNIEYSIPVYFWPEKTIVYSDAPVTAIVRILFS